LTENCLLLPICAVYWPLKAQQSDTVTAKLITHSSTIRGVFQERQSRKNTVVCKCVALL